MILVLGASGFIGYHLFHYFKKQGYTVQGTYHCRKKRGLLRFDLNYMNLKDIDLNLQEIKVVVIATGAYLRGIDDSKKHWKEAYHTNVVKIKELIDICFEHSIMPVYLSSDYVFDGKKGNYQETDKRHPITSYGRMKYEVENHILKSQNPFIILRMGRVIGWGYDHDFIHRTLLLEMLKALKYGEKLYCVDDQWITPLYVGDLCVDMEFLIKNKLQGVFHLASLPMTTRYRIAKEIQRYFGLHDGRIVHCATEDFHFLDKRPFRTDLNVSKFKEIFSVSQRDLIYYLEMGRYHYEDEGYRKLEKKSKAISDGG